MRKCATAAAFVVTTLALVLMATPIQAQTGVYGEIVGKVVDSSGGALPGTTITVTRASVGGAKNTTSEADGSYRFPAMESADDYKLVFELGGFGTITRNNVAVAVRTTTTLDVTMQVASLSESVTVTAESAAVDATSARAGASLRSDILQDLPSAKDSSAILALVAGAVRQNLNVGGSTTDLTNNIISNGSTQRNMNINGAETKAGSGDGRYNNYDAYEEINVESGSAGADTRRPGGGLSAELVARSGGNQFHGLGQVFWYNSSLVGDNVTDKLRAQGVDKSSDVVRLHQNTLQGGGPIKRNRIFFFASGGDFRVFRTVIGQTILQQGRLTPYLLNTTWQLSSNHKLTLFYSAVPKVQKGRSLSKFNDFLASENQEAKGTLRQSKWLGTFGSKMVAEAGFFTFKYWWPSNPQYAAIAATPFAGAPYNDSALGTAYNGFNGVNNIRNNHRTEGNFALTRFLPTIGGATNDIKVGMDSFYMYFRQDNFRGLGADPEVTYTVANGVPTFATIYSGPGRSLRGQKANSFFVQERFQKGRLTLNSGIRFDTYRAFIPAQSTNSAGTRWESIFPNQTFPARNNFVVWNNWSPRMNGVVKLDSAGKHLLKASWGFYPTELDPIGATDFANANNLRSQRYVWLGDLNGDHILQLNELGALRTTTNPGTSTVDPNLKNPNTKEASVAYETELPGRMGVKAQYFYSWYTDDNNDSNILVSASDYTAVPFLDPGPDGKAGTGDDKTITVYNQSAASVPLSKIQRRTVPGTWKKSHSFSISLSKRLANGFQLGSSYSYNQVRQNTTVDPNNLNAKINNSGFIVSSLDSPHAFKLYGSKLFRYGIQFSGNFNANVGLPYNRTLSVTGLNQGTITVIADPPGTWRYDNVKSLDIRFEKQLKLPKGQQMGFMLEGYNMLNCAASTDSDGAGVGSVTGGNFGIISKVMPPRTWRLGYRYTF